jgi:hypothetical protein
MQLASLAAQHARKRSRDPLLRGCARALARFGSQSGSPGISPHQKFVTAMYKFSVCAVCPELKKEAKVGSSLA